MTGATMTAIGAILILVTVAWYRFLSEKILRELSDVEKLTWVDSFSTQRIVATVFPVIVALIAVTVSWIWPGKTGWAVIVASIGLLVFSLLWQYILLRRIRRFRFSPRFVKQTVALMITTQICLIVGFGLMAFGVAGSRL